MGHKKKETRGRKKLPDGEGKTVVVKARVTPAEKARIERAAGKNVSEWARQKLLKAAG